MEKTIAVIGLGKMGANLARRLTKADWRVVGYNRTAEVTKQLESEGIVGAYSYADLIKSLPKPRVIILMLSAGKPIDAVLSDLTEYLEPGDIVIDGGNSFYQDTIRRQAELAKKQINFIDVGISGGPGGALNGACLMVGGEGDAAESLQPLFEVMALPGAVQYFSKVGAGHFVKMVHNGIEYGMMQAIAEGFAVLKAAPMQLDLEKVTDIYSNGSVIASRLIDWLKDGYVQYGVELEAASPTVQQNGEGMWTVQTAEALGVPVSVLKDSVEFRLQSAEHPSYTGRVLTTLRNQFGGHNLK